MCSAICPHTQVWLKRAVLKTARPGNRRGGSNPPADAAPRRENADVGESAETSGLLNRRMLEKHTAGSNPAVSAVSVTLFVRNACS